MQTIFSQPIIEAIGLGKRVESPEGTLEILADVSLSIRAGATAALDRVDRAPGLLGDRLLLRMELADLPARWRWLPEVERDLERTDSPRKSGGKTNW